MNKDAVVMHCLGCNENWLVPPEVHCPNCGPNTPAEPDPRIWALDKIPQTPIWMTAHCRDQARADMIASFLSHGSVVDVGDDPNGEVIWRPGPDFWREHSINYVEVQGLKDTRDGEFDIDALEQALAVLMHQTRIRRGVLIMCAAGLRRTPHLAYGYLRIMGRDPDEAWTAVKNARTPPIHQHQPYIGQIEVLVQRFALPV